MLMLEHIALILGLALIYGYLNGLHGSAGIVATMISSRALGPRQSLILAAVGISAGPFLLGTAVANTIGAELIAPEATNVTVVIAGLTGAVLWSALTLWLRLPSSISQALLGGLIGAAWAGFGQQAILSTGFNKVVLSLLLSPILGIIGGFVMVRFSYWLTASATPHINKWFKRGQVLISLFMAISFGANDGQKIIGIIVLGMTATGLLQSFMVPSWVVGFSAFAIGFGTLMGGWRLIHTLGGRFYRIRPIHGFGAQIASSLTIFGAAVLGGPVSGMQVIASSIVGAGGADRIQKVRWGAMTPIMIGWLLTLPFSALVGALTYYVVEGIIR
jgi:PiT family inorganic phosphate transporter